MRKLFDGAITDKVVYSVRRSTWLSIYEVYLSSLIFLLKFSVKNVLHLFNVIKNYSVVYVVVIFLTLLVDLIDFNGLLLALVSEL